MAEIVLVQPRMGIWDDLRSNPAIPLGLLHSANLAAREFDTCIIDRRLSANWKADLRKNVGPETLLVGFSVYSSGEMIADNLEMSEEVRGLTDAPVVWGGVHNSIDPESTISCPNIDIIVIGEGEETLLELARALKNSEPLDNIKGIWYKKDGRVYRNPMREFINLEDMPEIPYHLVDVQSYMPLFQGRKCLYFQSSRGCINKCSYCYNIPFNHCTYRYQSASKTSERLRYAVDKLGAEDIYFVDDNFFLVPERDRLIAEYIKDLGITWQIQGVDMLQIKNLDDDFMKLLRDSNLRKVGVGVESGNYRIRSLLKKPDRMEDIEYVIRRLVDHDISVIVNFMSGIPTETKEELKESIEFMLKLLEINPEKLWSPPVINYWPFPKTPLFSLAEKEGFKKPESLEDWSAISAQNYRNPNTEDKDFYESLYFVSHFIDRKAHHYGAPRFIRFLSDLYRPIAKWRVKRLNFNFLIEKKLADWVQLNFGKFLMKSRL